MKKIVFIIFLTISLLMFGKGLEKQLFWVLGTMDYSPYGKTVVTTFIDPSTNVNYIIVKEWRRDCIGLSVTPRLMSDGTLYISK